MAQNPTYRTGHFADGQTALYRIGADGIETALGLFPDAAAAEAALARLREALARAEETQAAARRRALKSRLEAYRRRQR